LFFVCAVNVQVKINLSIDNFIFLEIKQVNRILFGGGVLQKSYEAT